jgi:hypothetical protein
MRPQNRGGRQKPMERHAAAPILSLERIDFPFPLSLSVTKRWQLTTLNHCAFGAKQ